MCSSSSPTLFLKKDGMQELTSAVVVAWLQFERKALIFMCEFLLVMCFPSD